MALDPLQIVNEVSRLANSAGVTNSRRLDTNAHIVAALSLLSGGAVGGGGGGTISSGDVSAGINASTDIEAIKENLIAILAELVNSRGLDEQWVQDSSPTPIKMLRRVSVDQTTGAITVSYIDGSPAQTAVTPVLPVTPIGVSRAALTPVTYQLNNGAMIFDGYLDELSTPTALYTDLLRQTQVTIGSAPTDALGTSIKAVDPGLKTSRLADVRDGIDASGDIGTIINALNAIKGSTDLIDVAGGINSSTDINAIIADLDTLATNSITPVSGRLPVAIESSTVRDGINASTDIDDIKTDLAAIKTSVGLINVTTSIDASVDVEAIKTGIGTLATNSIAPVGGRLPVAIADVPGTGITGETIASGGDGLFGWLSSIAAYSRQILDRIPALVSGRIPVDANVSTSLTTIISRLSNNKAYQLDWVERVDTGELLTRISNMTDTGAMAPYLYMQANGSVVVEPGAVRPASPGTAITGETIGTGGAGSIGWLSTIASYARQLLASAGAPADAVATSDTGSFSWIALFKRLLQRQSNIYAVQCTGSRSGGTAGNAAVTGTIAAPGAGSYIWIRGYSFSYSAAPSAARTLTISSGGVDLVNIDVTTSGAGPVVIGVAAPANTAVTFSLAASGTAGNVGKLTIYHTVLGVI